MKIQVVIQSVVHVLRVNTVDVAVNSISRFKTVVAVADMADKRCGMGTTIDKE